MPKPIRVTPDQVPDRPGTRTKSSAQKFVDDCVVEARDEGMFEQLPTDGSGVLLHFTADDDPGFAFTGASTAHLKDRCRRMIRAAMKEHLPPELDAQLTITYDIPVTKHSDEALSVDGFRAFVTRSRAKAT